jgi:N-acetylmuramoyl-L-alanine amidase
MTREIDRSLRLRSRAKFANRLEVDLITSIHVNTAASPDVEGMEVFHYPGSFKGGQAADAVLNSTTGAFSDHRNRGMRKANFAVLQLTAMPAILV